MNSVTLVGRLGQDPEARTTTGGMVLANFSVATKGRKKDGDAWVEDTTWHRCTAFGKTTEFLVKYGAKGREVAIRGSYKSRTWEKDGVTQTRMEVSVDEAELVGPKKESTDAPAPSGGVDEDIPF